MNEHLHIVCLDAPTPPDYGGAIDMYYKIAALSNLGIKISLHYFNYNKKRNIQTLEKYCSKIYSYKRKNYLQSAFFMKPYTVASRINKKLINRLNRDSHPILLEGIHCAGIIKKIENAERVVLRMHNDEASYYKSLAKTENNLFKRLYFSIESIRLNKFQKSLNKKIKLAFLSLTDKESFQKNYFFNNTYFIPCFVPWQSINCHPGIGTYCLYHGNLEVSENNVAAAWLIKNVFSKVNIPLVIAGRAIPKKLTTIAAACKNISFVYNPSENELDKLIQEAHINILPSLNSTGVKLKLLHALFEGRFCITNENGIKGSGLLRTLVDLADDSETMIASVQKTFRKKFTELDSSERSKLLEVYTDEKNARKLSELW